MNELLVGDSVTIRYSKKLEQNGNSLLTNRSGVVTRVHVSSGKIVGAYVDVKVMRRVRNYYVPLCSIEGPDEINRLRNMAILKSTIL